MRPMVFIQSVCQIGAGTAKKNGGFPRIWFLTGLVNSKQLRLISRCWLQSQFLVAQFSRDAALRGAVEVAFHDEIRLIDLLNCVRLLADGDGERDRKSTRLNSSH